MLCHVCFVFSVWYIKEDLFPRRIHENLYNGRKILGYKGSKGQRYKVDEATAPVVCRIFRDYCRGVGMQTIADELNREGLRTSRNAPFTVNSLRWILKNEAYIGVYRYGEIRIDDGMPAIISRED